MALYIPNASPIPLEEAQRLVLATVRPLPVASIPLSRAYGYCLADPVLSDHNVPMYDRSTVDGYALRAEDVKWASRSTPVKLNTIEEIPAGHIPEKQIAPGMASRIMTGAPIPKGADAVVKVEETEIGEDEGRSSVWIYRSVTAGESILRKGADVEEGTIILPEGPLSDLLRRVFCPLLESGLFRFTINLRSGFSRREASCCLSINRSPRETP